MWLKTLLRLALLGSVVVLLNACSDAASEAEAVDNKVPQTVAAQPKDTEVVVTWDPVPYAERYIVCWAYVPITDCDPANPKIVRIDPAPALTEPKWAHAGITNSTEYHYAVIAVLAEGESAISANVSGIPEGITPPTVVSISTYDLTATIGWEPVVGASGYRLHMATQEGVTVGNPEPALPGYMSHDVPAGDLQYMHTGLAGGQAYYFIVTALKDVGGGEILESVESQEVIAIPKVLGAYEEGFVPKDFTVTARFGATGSAIPGDYYDIDMTNPCAGTNGNQYQIHWDVAPISDIPANCDPLTAKCFTDINLGETYNLSGDNVVAGELYYFTAVNLTLSACETSTSPAPTAAIISGNIGAKTPGVLAPPVPVFTAVVPQDIANAVTITIEQYDPNLKYNLYMVSNQFFQAGNTTLTVENHELDVNWGMKHSDIPKVFVHKALPSSLQFSFIVTAVNSVGDESAASEMVTATP